MSGEIDTWQFPPNRKPKFGNLEEGDPILILSLGNGKLLGELRFKEARFVDYEEFEREFRERAYEVRESPFPSHGQSCWVMVFNKITQYEHEVDKDKIVDFPIRGLFPLTDKYWISIREKSKNLGGIRRTIRPRDFHEDACEKLEELGKFFGWFSKKEYIDRDVPIDVAWKERRDFPKVNKAFEVKHRGSLLEALSHLQHVSDWGRDTVLFLVVTDEKDRKKAKKSLELEPYFSGTFHRIRDQTEILTYEELIELYEAIKNIRLS